VFLAISVGGFAYIAVNAARGGTELELAMEKRRRVIEGSVVPQLSWLNSKEN